MAEKPGRRGDEALALALAAGLNQTEAAARAGISTRTARRRLEDPAFQARVRELRAETLGRAAGLLAEASTEAVETLRGLLKADSEAVRLGAARAILEQGIKVREATELEERLAALEAAEAARDREPAGAFRRTA